MFTYKNHSILSAAPITEINAYLRGLGAVELPGSAYEYVYEYEGLKITICPCDSETFPGIHISHMHIERHLIEVQGGKEEAEEFLTAFRLRFMSAGG